MPNIGLQFWSVREAMSEDLLGTIEKVSEMGYSGAQFAGFFDQDAKNVKQTLDRVGMKAAGAHVQIDLLQNQLDETMTYHDTIGNDLIIVPFLPEDMRTTVDDYKRTSELLEKIGGQLHSRGFTLGYHNHDFEFKLFGEKTGLDLIFEQTDPNHVKMELDCFWAAFTDNDPMQVIDTYADRCVSLHIKDLKLADGQPISTELGSGQLPLKDYMRKGKEIGVDWFVVEQEHFTQDPLDSATKNAKSILQLNNS